MSKYNLPFIIFVLVFGGVAYLVTENLILTVIVSGVSFIYLFVFALRKIKKYEEKIINFHLCYHFINSFIIGTSIRKTISGGYETAKETNDLNFKKELASVEHLLIVERLEYLRKYFPYNIYAIFVEEIRLYEDQGGDILQISKNLIDESRKEESYLVTVSQKGKAKMTELVILWFFTFLILGFIRLGLGQFFLVIKEKIFFVVLVGVFFLFVLISIHITLSVICQIDLKEAKPNE